MKFPQHHPDIDAFENELLSLIQNIDFKPVHGLQRFSKGTTPTTSSHGSRISEKRDCTVIQFDIEVFYSFITEYVIEITKEKENILMHSRKSLPLP